MHKLIARVVVIGYLLLAAACGSPDDGEDSLGGGGKAERVEPTAAEKRRVQRELNESACENLFRAEGLEKYGSYCRNIPCGTDVDVATDCKDFLANYVQNASTVCSKLVCR